MSLHSLKQDFLEYLEIEKNRSQKTISNYDFYLSRFLDWLRSDKVSDITDEKIKDYRLHLNRLTDKDGENLKKNTQNYHLIALRAWLKYLSRKDIKTLAPEKIELMSMPDRDISFLLPEEVERLLAAPLLAFSRALKKNDQAKPPLNALRDKAIIELLFSTGMRVSELVGLKKETINLNSEEFTVFGKGRKKRVVFLSESARAWLKKYLAGRHDLNPALFIAHGRRGGEEGEDGLTARSIERIIHAHAKAAGIMKPVTPHTLRHSYATDLLQNGADIRSVQSMLGHSSITTTQIYTHVTDKELKAVHKKFHGRKKIDK